MGHFAKVTNNLVVDVKKSDQEFIDSFVDSSPGEWLQTSYNTRGGVHYGQDGQPDGGVALRKNFAGIGFTYDPVRDAFIPPKPFKAWVLNEETCLWNPPTPHPTDGNAYEWDDASDSWKLFATAVQA